MFVDSHCHLDRLDKSQGELKDIVAFAQQRGVEHMLCVAVSVREFPEMLAKVQQANLFLIPLDEPAAWFRYHHLFSDFLQQKLKQSLNGNL